MKKYGWKQWAGAAALLGLALLWLPRETVFPVNAAEISATEAAYRDSLTLAGIASHELDADAPVTWTMKKSGYLQRDSGSWTDSGIGTGTGLEERLESYGNALSRQLGLSGSGAVELRGEEAIYRNERPISGGCQETLLLIELDDGQSYAAIGKQCSATTAELASLAEWIREVDTRLEQAGASGYGRGPNIASELEWNVTIQGSPRAWQGMDPPQAEQRVLGMVERYGAAAIDRYADGRTVSMSFSSPDMHRSVRTDAADIHFQTAVHQDSISGQWRLTLGAPVITTEY